MDNDIENVTYPFRFWFEEPDGTLVFKYKKTKLAAKRAYLKFGRDNDNPGIVRYGWETVDHVHLIPGFRTYWVDADSIVPPLTLDRLAASTVR